ncbi:hypothetical protein L198_00126 [Cryptococcus wingfieldii CBS 7118]|uniref:Major facilitator superfamily (MFS) profile domain-containing protein n=1 Tax=Cryptococcus wingfieldii CBS 7118 TaxID=1295528 RepID=A0A1E3K5C0_9TREE|nr:hypothetical protein L198_00126 [Cryptococcus wingfieldii CBS 7118]ODO08398.1 hypothetical protein L198_00126 [Cryptococcus wingfieldii CBS 7118]
MDPLQTSAENPEREVRALPAVDTSREAWLYVFAGFSMEMLFWGPMYSTAVYLKEYAAMPLFKDVSETEISLVGTLGLLFGYILSLPLLYFYNAYPRAMKPSLWFGVALYVVSMLIASFVKSMPLLILFQGVGPGIAAALTASPIIRWIPEWFDKRKGTAGGIIFAGGGVGGVYMPFLFEFLIGKLGYQWSLRITAISTATIASVAVFFANPRIPISSRARINRMPMPPFFTTYLRWGFLCTFLCTMFQSFGYYNVNLFLPRFSDTLKGAEGAGLLAAFNVSCIGSQIIWGLLTDRMKPAAAMAISSSLGALFVLTLWGFGGNQGLPVLAPFAILFGLAAGGFCSMWFQNAGDIAGPDKEQQSLLSAGWSIARGVGAVIGPTIGSALYRTPSVPGSNRWGSAGSPGLVGLVAASLAGSALVVLVFRYAESAVKALRKYRNGEMERRRVGDFGVELVERST